MRYLSHLELVTVFTRAVSKGGVPILFSLGFHPHPRFSFGTATSVGIESQAEYMDMFVAAGIGASAVQHRLNAVLPEGLCVLDAVEVHVKSPSISTIIDATRYRITFVKTDPKTIYEQCVQFMAQPSVVIQRTKKGQIQSVDLRKETLSLSADGQSVDLVAKRGKPIEYARAITGNIALSDDDVNVEKTEVLFTP
jgi:radical SAM-linked protein